MIEIIQKPIEIDDIIVSDKESHTNKVMCPYCFGVNKSVEKFVKKWIIFKCECGNRYKIIDRRN